MLKTIFILLLGLAIGYSYGFKDARAHDQTVVTRMLDQVGGSTRGKVSNDVDSKMDKAER